MQMSVPGIDTGVESAATRAETSSHRRPSITITDRKAIVSSETLGGLD